MFNATVVINRPEVTCIGVTWHISNHFTKLHGQTHAPVGMVTTVQYNQGPVRLYNSRQIAS